MIKVMVVIKKRPDITASEFRRYYEQQHAPLVDVLLPYYATYRRNYVDGPVFPGGPGFSHDVFTELEFASEADFAAWQVALRTPEVLARIRADEANFIAAGETRMWVVSPFESDYADRSRPED